MDSHYLSRIVSCEVESLHRKSTRFRQQHGTNRREFVTEFRVLRRKFWQVSRLIRSSRIQRCRSFSERVGPPIIFLKASLVSSCSKRSREITTEPIAVLTKNRQSMIPCGFCCYYLEHCSKTNHHNAIKRTKYAKTFLDS